MEQTSLRDKLKRRSGFVVVAELTGGRLHLAQNARAAGAFEQRDDDSRPL